MTETNKHMRGVSNNQLKEIDEISDKEFENMIHYLWLFKGCEYGDKQWMNNAKSIFYKGFKSGVKYAFDRADIALRNIKRGEL